MAAHYGGALSKPFWDRVNKLPPEHAPAVYALGVALQDLEARTLRWLANAEAAKKPKVKR